eukprot:4279903-Pleurochrysis_carterae.AAC.1
MVSITYTLSKAFESGEPPIPTSVFSTKAVEVDANSAARNRLRHQSVQWRKKLNAMRKLS